MLLPPSLFSLLLLWGWNQINQMQWDVAVKGGSEEYVSSVGVDQETTPPSVKQLSTLGSNWWDHLAIQVPWTITPPRTMKISFAENFVACIYVYTCVSWWHLKKCSDAWNLMIVLSVLWRMATWKQLFIAATIYDSFFFPLFGLMCCSLRYNLVCRCTVSFSGREEDRLGLWWRKRRADGFDIQDCPRWWLSCARVRFSVHLSSS